MSMADWSSAPPLIALSAATALATTLLLLRRSPGGRGLPGCGQGSGCDAVTASRWSRWGRVPVAGRGAVVYLVMFAAAVLAFPAAPEAARRIGWSALTLLAPLAAGAALWFTGLQVLAVRRHCPYCLLAHLAGALAGGWARSAGPLRAGGAGGAWWTHPLYLFVPGAVLLLFLIAGQILIRPKLYAVVGPKREGLPTTHDTPPPAVSSADRGVPPPSRADPVLPTRQVVALGGKVVLSAADWPLLGEPTAQAFIVYLFDYTCPECRSLHRLLEQAVLRYAGRLAVLAVPVPADPACNPTIKRREALHAYACAYARLGLALWAAGPAAYREYDRWVFEPDRPPPFGLALAKARDLAAALADFRADVPDPEIDPRLGKAVDLFRAAGTGQIPTLLFPRGAAFGRVADEAELLQILAARAGLGPPPAGT